MFQDDDDYDSFRTFQSSYPFEQSSTSYLSSSSVELVRLTSKVLVTTSVITCVVPLIWTQLKKLNSRSLFEKELNIDLTNSEVRDQLQQVETLLDQFHLQIVALYCCRRIWKRLNESSKHEDQTS